jgi:predicted MFS family arabinose efflux permease
MSTATAAPARPVPQARPLTRWLAVVTLTVGIFSIVTVEILPIGLLVPIGASFGLSDGRAGLMMTMPGFVAAVAAPAVTVASGRLDRRTMLGGLMLLLALADLLAALAPAYWVMLLSRILVGLVIGGFWSIGAGLAPRLVLGPRVATATSVIFSAVPLGSVLGVPAGTLIGQLAGWRAAFAVMGVLTVGVFVAITVLVPPLPAEDATRLGVLRMLLRRRRTWAALAVTFLIVTAHFGTYTYVTPFLAEVVHVGPGGVTALLLAYGTAGVAGNFVAGATVGRGRRATFVTAAALLAGVTLLLPLTGGSVPVAAALLVGWGFAYGAVPVCSQACFARAAGPAREAATVLFTSSFQATLSTGALVGGVVVDATSTSVVMVLGGVVATLAALVLWNT